MSLVLILFLGVVVTAAFLLRKSYPGRCNAVLVASAVAMLVIAVTRLSYTNGDALLAQEVNFGTAIGSVLGREIAADYPGGAVVAIVQPSPIVWGGRDKVYDSTVRALRRVLNGGRYAFHVVQQATPPDGEPLESDFISSEEYRALLAHVPDASVVVLQHIVFEPDAQSQAADLPPVYIISGAAADMSARLMDEGYARAMVDYRAGADWSVQPVRGQAEEDIFNLRYELIRSKL